MRAVFAAGAFLAVFFEWFLNKPAAEFPAPWIGVALSALFVTATTFVCWKAWSELVQYKFWGGPAKRIVLAVVLVVAQFLLATALKINFLS